MLSFVCAVAYNPTGIYVSNEAFTVGPLLIESCFFGDGSGTSDVRPWIIFDGWNLSINNSFFGPAGPTMEIIRINAQNGTNQNILLTGNYFQGSANARAAIVRKTPPGTVNIFTAINNLNPNGTTFLDISGGAVLNTTFIPEL